MIVLGDGDTITAGATSATTVNCTIAGAITDNNSPAVLQHYDVIYQGQLGSSVATLFTPSSQNVLIKSIHLYNTGATQQTVNIGIKGTATSNYIATVVLPANGWATYVDGVGWKIYSSSGLEVVGGVIIGTGLGTPSSATTALTASTEVLQGGTLFSLPTPAGPLAVGTRIRWTIGLEKTAAGIATWAMKVKAGTNGTTADAAIASWTSGTNTAAIDQADLTIECVITALGSGSGATANCICFYANTLTNVTGLGRIDPVPTTTAGFDSTTATFMHVDITAGASAVMTGVGMAELVKG